MKNNHALVNTKLKQITSAVRMCATLLLTTNMMLATQANAESAATPTQVTTQQAAQTIDHVLAVVNDTPILASDLTEAIANAKAAFSKAGKPLPPQNVLEATVLDRLITRTSQMNIITRSGQNLSDQAINATLLQIANKQGFDTLTDFQMMLEEKQVGGYAQLRKQIREEMTINQLREQAIRRRVQISEQDVDYFLRSPESEKLFKNEFRTHHLRVSLPVNIASDSQRAAAFAVAKQIKQDLDANLAINDVVKRAQSQKQFRVQGGDMGFHPQNALPKYLKDAILSLKVGGTSDPVVNKDGIHVVKLVDKKGEKAQTVSQWKVRHILIKPTQLKSLAQAKQNIDDLYEKLRNNADFSTLASTYSDDPGSAKKGGSLDWVSPGQMVPAFEAMTKRTPVGDFSTPFRSQFGWHILKVEATRNKDMSNEFKRALARKTLYKRMSTQALEDWMQELRSNSYVKILDPKYQPES